MPKSARSVLLIITSIVGLVILATIAYCILSHARPSIRDVWVINLEKAKDRWSHIQATYNGSLPLYRWDATYGKTTLRTAANADGVDILLSRPCSREEDNQSDFVVKNAGEIGCWLSHKRLLRHLSNQAASAEEGHLICEDDIEFHNAWYEEWKQLAPTIPTNWDMVYFGIGSPVGHRLGGRILKAYVKEDTHGNWGTHAYLVRHGSIPKILDTLRTMSNPIDVQYNINFDRLNVYIIDPSLLHLNSTLSANSSIQEASQK